MWLSKRRSAIRRSKPSARQKPSPRTGGLDHDKLDPLAAFRFVEIEQGIRRLGPIITGHRCPVLQRSDDIGDISPEHRMKQRAVDLLPFAGSFPLK
jgi:hypothetical protein